MMAHLICVGRLQAMITGDLSPRLRRYFLRHISDCADCRQAYEKLLAVEAALQAPGALLTSGQTARIGAAVIESTRRSRAVYAGVGALAAAAMVLIAAGLDDGFQARGVGAAGDRAVQVRAYCVSAEPGALSGLYPTPAMSWRALRNRCTTADTMRFEYEASSDASGHLFVLGVDDGLEPHWYHPIPAEGASVEIRGGGRHELPGGVALGINHRPGRLRVVTLVSDRRIVVGSVERALRRLRSDSDGLGALAELLGDDVEQGVFSIHLEAP